MNNINIITPDQLAQITNPASAGILVLCTETNEFLLTKRTSKAKVLPSTWSVPSGEANVNELEGMEDCARREFTEETMYTIPPADRLTCFDRYFTGSSLYFVYILRVKQKFFIKLNFEHMEAGWFTRDTLPEPLSPQIMDVISKMS